MDITAIDSDTGDSIVLSVASTATVAWLKLRLCEEWRKVPFVSRLTMDGVALDTTLALSDTPLGEGATVHLSQRDVATMLCPHTYHDTHHRSDDGASSSYLSTCGRHLALLHGNFLEFYATDTATLERTTTLPDSLGQLTSVSGDQTWGVFFRFAERDVVIADLSTFAILLKIPFPFNVILPDCNTFLLYQRGFGSWYTKPTHIASESTIATTTTYSSKNDPIVSPDGSYLAVFGDGIVVHSVGSGAVLGRVAERGVEIAAFSPCGEKLAVCIAEVTDPIRVYNWQAGTVLHSFGAGIDVVGCEALLFTPCSNYLLQGDAEDQLVNQWCLRDGKILTFYNNVRSPILLSPCSRYMIAYSASDEVELNVVPLMQEGCEAEMAEHEPCVPQGVGEVSEMEGEGDDTEEGEDGGEGEGRRGDGAEGRPAKRRRVDKE